MSSCCLHARSAGRLFSFFAHRYRKRFRKKGFEPSQQQLMAGLEQVGYRDATVLEIGCGVGHLHQSLLEQGADSAVGIDLASSMLDEARDWAGERGLHGRTDYVEGDFMLVADQVDPADISLLDKVVCCYPDAQGLLEKSLARTKRVIALTYPRDRWFVRLGVSAMTCALWIARSDFRSYVHDPVQIEHWITASGMEKRFEDVTTAWLTQVYVKA
jgi:SAM-dependent methyltransferase